MTDEEAEFPAEVQDEINAARAQREEATRDVKRVVRSVTREPLWEKLLLRRTIDLFGDEIEKSMTRRAG